MTVQKALDFKDQIEDDAINNFISQTEPRSHTQCFMIEAAFDSELEEDPLKDAHDQTIPVTVVANSKVVEIEPGKALNINTNLTPDQETKLVNLLRKYQGKLPTKSLKDKLIQNLINKGFSFQESKNAINQLELEADEENEHYMRFRALEQKLESGHGA